MIFQQGTITQTGIETDVAISGDGFFKIKLPNGDAAYTRDGRFTLDAEGNFVTAEGYPLFDGALNLYRFNNPGGLKSIGGNLFRATEDSGAEISIDLSSASETTVLVQSSRENLLIVESGTSGADTLDNPVNQRVYGTPLKRLVFTTDSVYNVESVTFTQGTIEPVDNPLNLALDGEGFFKIMLPNGDAVYTRNGAFTFDDAGNLTTELGYRLFDNVNIPSGVNIETVEITGDGTVAYTQNGSRVVSDQRVNVYRFEDQSALRPLNLVDNDLFRATDASGEGVQIDLASASTSIVQNALERDYFQLVGKYDDVSGVEFSTLETTNNPLDVAIVEEGFFKIQLPNGDAVYTRNGKFTLDADGNFVIADEHFTYGGYRLFDNVNIPSGVETDSIKIGRDGQVLYVQNDREVTGQQIGVYRFINPSGLTPLNSVDNYIFRASEVSGPEIQIDFNTSGETSALIQGMLEQNAFKFINNYGTGVSLNGGAGNDSIRNDEAGNTIVGGNGNDTIRNTNKLSLIDASLVSLEATGNPLDIALEGEGFYKVRLSNGAAAYTRNGDFTRDSIGNLVTADGLKLFGNVSIPSDVSSDSITIDRLGNVSYTQNDATVEGQALDVYRFANVDGLASIGSGLYSATSLSGSEVKLDFNDSGQRTSIIQGYVETSGVRDDKKYLTAIAGGNGNDLIDNVLGDYVSINAGEGNDTIYSCGSLVTIRGGTGNDLIYNGSASSSIAGLIKETGNPLSVAIDGEGFFKVQLSSGAAAYTRIGDFRLDANGNFVTRDGYKLFDNVNIPADAQRDTVVIAGDGQVSYTQNGQPVTGQQIYVYYFVNPDGLASIGSGLYSSTSASGEEIQIDFNTSGETTVLLQGVVELLGDEDFRNSRTVIEGGAGNDTIIGANEGEIFMFAADGGSDLITNFGFNDTLRITSGSLASTTKSGSDFVVNVQNSQKTATITLGGAGDFNFVRNGQYLAVDLSGYLVNEDNGVAFNGTSRADYMLNSGSNVTINGGLGNDTMLASSNAEVFQFRTDGGNDVIKNFGEDDTIHIAAGLLSTYYVDGSDMIIGAKGTSYSGTIRLIDAAGEPIKVKVGSRDVQTLRVVNSISNTARNTVVNGTGANDSIYNYARNVTIDGRAGSDTIESYGSAVSLFGGDGNDSIKTTGGSLVTLHGGAGNDTLTGASSGEIFQFRSDGGDDVITNFNSNDTLHIAAGTLNSYYADGNDLIVNAKGVSYSGTIRLKNAAANPIMVKVGTGSVKTIQIPKTIANTTRNTLITGSLANDSINNRAKNVTIDGGNGNDTIETFGNNVSVFGGAGADSIKSTGGLYVTLHGGAGNDTLTGASSGEIFLFRSDGGNDVITNFDSNDTLQIAAGILDTYRASGNDLIVGAKGTSYSGTIRLLGAAGDSIKVKDGNRAVQTIKVINEIANTTRNTVVTGTSASDVIDNYARNVTITSGAGDDTIETFGNSVSVFGGDGDDSLKTTGGLNVTLHGGKGNDTLTGSSYGEVFRFRSDGDNDVATNFGSNDTLHIAAGELDSYWLDGSDLIVRAKGINYTGTIRLSGVGNDPIKIKILSNAVETIQIAKTKFNTSRNTLVSGTGENDSLYNYARNVTINGGAGNDSIETFGNNVSVEGGAGNDLLRSTGGLNVTLHGGAGNDTLEGSTDPEVFQFRSDGGNDVVTSFGANDTLQLTAGIIETCYADGNDMIIGAKGTNYSGTIRLIGAADSAIKFKDDTRDVQTIRVVNNISNTARNTVVTGTGANDSIHNYARNVTIRAGAGADTIQTYGNSVSVFGGDGNDSLRSTGGSLVTLHGGAGNDTLTGASSAEIFQFRSDGGDDVITNFNINDTLKITAGSIQNYYANGADYIVEVKGTSYSGTITLLDAVERGTLRKSGINLTLRANNAQLTSNEYWFEREVEAASNEINSILAVESKETGFEVPLGLAREEKMIGVVSSQVGAAASRKKVLNG